ncbi:MAG: ABC transporter ATP-binding protein/permease [Alphaproteobacteria bacterium]|nr:ABC transporter ATP-binding protein/permease [Alphaproteobacteria bacterium]
MGTAIYLLKQYWKNTKGRRPLAVLTSLMMIVSFGLWLFQPLLFGAIINTIQNYQGAAAIDRIVFLAFLWVGIYLGFNTVYRLSEHFAVRLGYYAKAQYIARNYRKLTRLPLSWHADHHSGESINRVSRAADELEQMINWQWNYWEVSTGIVGSIAGLFYLNWKVASIALATTVVFYIIIGFIDRKIEKRLGEINEMRNRVSASLFDFVSNIRSIITLRMGERTAHEIDAKVEAARKPTIQAWGVLGQIKWAMFSISFMFLHAGIVVYFVLSDLYSATPIDLGMLTAIYLYLEKIGFANYEMAGAYNRMITQKAALRNAEIIEAAAEAPAPAKAPAKWKKFAAEGVKFSHSDGHGKDVICGADFCFKRGEKIALMGESGAGKSTLLTLLRGLNREKRGKMLIDGKSSRHGIGALSSITTLMLQDPEVFENTIRYNITMGLDYTDAEIARALRLSRFDQVIKKLPHGLETDIREKGVNLSGGERQRLALARNILSARDSDIILMDEITSSVDVENESLIYDALLSEFGDKTIIAAVHKPAMAAKFGRIVRIEKGAVLA